MLLVRLASAAALGNHHCASLFLHSAKSKLHISVPLAGSCRVCVLTNPVQLLWKLEWRWSMRFRSCPESKLSRRCSFQAVVLGSHGRCQRSSFASCAFSCIPVADMPNKAIRYPHTPVFRDFRPHACPICLVSFYSTVIRLVSLRVQSIHFSPFESESSPSFVGIT